MSDSHHSENQRRNARRRRNHQGSQQQQQQQRPQHYHSQRQTGSSSIVGTTIRTITTTAVLAYGAYKVYEFFNTTNNNNTNDLEREKEEEEDQEEEEEEEVTDRGNHESDPSGVDHHINSNGDSNTNHNTVDDSDGRRNGSPGWNDLSQWIFSSIFTGWEREEGQQQSSSSSFSTRMSQSKQASATNTTRSTSTSSSTTSTTSARKNHQYHYRKAQQNLRKCREETLKAFDTCWPSLQLIIEKSTDTSRQTQQLRKLRQQRQHQQQQPSAATTTAAAAVVSSSSTTITTASEQEQLWRDIQVETLTRLISTEYAVTLLFLSLTMQMHWIGGQVFQQKYFGITTTMKNQRNNTTRRSRNGRTAARPVQPQQQQHPDRSRWAQEVMMDSHQYMTRQGIPLLITAVRQAISWNSHLQEWTSTSYVLMFELEDILRQVDHHLEHGSGSSSYCRNWIRLVLPDPTFLEDDDDQPSDDEDEEEGDSGQSRRYSSNVDRVAMVEALWDLAESPTWTDGQGQTLQMVRHYLRDQGWGRVYGCGSYGDEQQGSAVLRPSTTTSTTPATVPVAKLVAPFKSACGLVSATTLQGRTTTNHNGGFPSSGSSRNKYSLPHKIQKLGTVLELGVISFEA